MLLHGFQTFAWLTQRFHKPPPMAYMIFTSVADPGSDFFHPGSKWIPDPHPQQEFKYFHGPFHSQGLSLGFYFPQSFTWLSGFHVSFTFTGLITWLLIS
jgi:hypothetical protein